MGARRLLQLGRLSPLQKVGARRLGAAESAHLRLGVGFKNRQLHHKYKIYLSRECVPFDGKVPRYCRRQASATRRKQGCRVWGFGFRVQLRVSGFELSGLTKGLGCRGLACQPETQNPKPKCTPIPMFFSKPRTRSHIPMHTRKAPTPNPKTKTLNTKPKP